MLSVTSCWMVVACEAKVAPCTEMLLAWVSERVSRVDTREMVLVLVELSAVIDALRLDTLAASRSLTWLTRAVVALFSSSVVTRPCVAVSVAAVDDSELLVAASPNSSAVTRRSVLVLLTSSDAVVLDSELICVLAVPTMPASCVTCVTVADAVSSEVTRSSSRPSRAVVALLCSSVDTRVVSRLTLVAVADVASSAATRPVRAVSSLSSVVTRPCVEVRPLCSVAMLVARVWSAASSVATRANSACRSLSVNSNLERVLKSKRANWTLVASTCSTSFKSVVMVDSKLPLVMVYG